MFYYIRLHGNVYGPYETNAMQGFVREGRVAANSEVSPDKVNWTYAAYVPELFPPPTPQAPAVQTYQAPQAYQPSQAYQTAQPYQTAPASPEVYGTARPVQPRQYSPPSDYRTDHYDVPIRSRRSSRDDSLAGTTVFLGIVSIVFSFAVALCWVAGSVGLSRANHILEYSDNKTARLGKRLCTIGISMSFVFILIFVVYLVVTKVIIETE